MEVVAISGGYPIAILLADDFGALLSTEVGLSVGLIVLFCVVVALVGAKKLRDVQENSRALSSALDAERKHGEQVAALVLRLGPMLGVLSIEGVLRWAAETARWWLGVPYAHVATYEGNHRTATDGDLDAYPSWWHPKIQRLVLWSCQMGEVLRDEGIIHGIKGFVAVPMISAEDERLGAVVVGGRNFSTEDERALKVLASGMIPALRSVSEAPGGRDPVTGLPNRASLRRVLRRELSSHVPLTVVAVKLNGFERYDRVHGAAAGDALLEKLGEKLRGNRRWVFHSGRDELIFLLQGNDGGRADRYARGLRRLLMESTSGSAVSLDASAGFVTIGPDGGDPDLALDAAVSALRGAEHRPDRILGLPPGAGAATAKDAEVNAQTAQVVQALLEAIGARHPHLAVHSRAVSELARRIGFRMGLPREQVDVLAVGALLHDVGKLAIPDSILQKTGPLTEDEYDIVKQHPAVGVRILSSIRELSAALPAVRHHHERFDGEGYPDGLRGEDIPLLARITLAADAFDSITRDRGYRRGVPVGAALDEMVRNSGIQFDPDVVVALVHIVEESENRSSGFAG